MSLVAAADAADEPLENGGAMQVVTQHLSMSESNWEVRTPIGGEVTVSANGIVHQAHAQAERFSSSGLEQIQFFGLRRSGNHALISFLMDRFRGRRIHANNLAVSGRGQARLAVGHLTETPGESEARGCCLASFEDHPLRRAADLPFGSKRVLVLRDPFNMFASRLQMIRNRPGTSHASACSVNPRIVALWKSYAREFLGETEFLGKTIVPISFNRWLDDQAYREEIGGQFGDASKKWPEISPFSQGSSFDGFDFADTPMQMDLLNRWKAFRKDPQYCELFDDEVIALSQRIFGPPPTPWLD